MTDDTVNADFEEIRRLKTLAPLYLKGWEKLHPMPEKDRALIEQAFTKTLHGNKTQATEAPKKKPTKTLTKRKATTTTQPDQSQTKTQGPSHSH